MARQVRTAKPHVSRLGLDPLSYMAEVALQEFVRYAAGRAVWCPGCSEVMDCTRTLVGERANGRTVIRCTACGLPAGVTVTHDGRELFPSPQELRALRTAKGERALNGHGLFRRVA